MQLCKLLSPYGRTVPVMCIFTGPVHVEATRIFARLEGEEGTQIVAYEMQVSLDQEGAMVLPLPLHFSRRELGLVDLGEYTDFFEDLDYCFPKNLPRSTVVMEMDASELIEVQRVGAFDASFLPTLADFDRLDPIFQMPPGTWDKLEQYQDYGFAVFKLRTGEEQHVHPMAFRFASRDMGRLFFPTVHVHNRKVKPKAVFDHALYAQYAEQLNGDWELGQHLPKRTMRVAGSVGGDGTCGLVLPMMNVWKKTLSGKLPNSDTWAAPKLGAGSGA